MDSELRRKLAPYGLYLSLVAAILAAGWFIVQKSWDLPLQIALGVVVLGLALAAFLDPGSLRKALTGRQARYGSNALIMTLAFVGILIVVNYLVYGNSRRWDLTENKENTLAPETLDTLQQLKQPVLAKAFFTVNYPTDTAKKLLESYKYNSNGQFDYKFIDPEADPVAAREAKIARDGTIVVTLEDRQEQLTYASEQELTSAIIRLANPGKRAVYFLTGHGEYAPSSQDERSYQQAANTLTAKNYTINTLNLITNPTIPEDALAIVIAGYLKPLQAQEIELLNGFLQKGGALIVLAEPRVTTELGAETDPLAAYLEKNWGITLNDDIIIDPNVQPSIVAAASTYENHPITQKLQSMVTLFPSARSIKMSEQAPDGITLTSLIKTSDNTWGETDIEALKKNEAKPDQGIDNFGPLTLAVAATNQQANTRLVVIGDADFASDQNFAQYGNGDLIANVIDWGAGQDNLISLTPKSQTQRMLISPSKTVMGLILLGLIVLAGIPILASIVVWLQRRRQG